LTHPSDPYQPDPYQPPTGGQPDPYGQVHPLTGEQPQQPQQPNAYGQLQPQYTQPHPQAYPQPQPYGQYGYPPQPGYGYAPQPPQQQEQGLAIASLICSLVGLIFCLPAILGIIFGHIGYSKAKRGEAGGQGMAQAGMIIGYVICGLWAIPLLIWLVFGLAVLGGASVS
jgi:hypothetical protein